MKSFIEKENKLLLHICCAGCGVYISEVLGKDFTVTLFFSNSNIWPPEEYERRRVETVKIAAQFNLSLLVDCYDHQAWLTAVAGHEKDPERGERCSICYRYRLEKTFTVAQSSGFNYVASTLSVSPHKDYPLISKIGNEMAVQYRVNFLDQDFKKQDGFKKSTQLSRELNLYRQNYCGCEFSIR